MTTEITPSDNNHPDYLPSQTAMRPNQVDDAFQEAVLNNVEFELADPRDEALRRFLEDQISGDHGTIPDLSAADKKRLHFVAVPTTHVAEYAADAASKLSDVDYVLMEGVGCKEHVRQQLDLATNLSLQGARINFSPNSAIGIRLVNLMVSDDWASSLTRQLAMPNLRRGHPPIFITIDMAEDTPGFDWEDMSPDSLLIVDQKELYSLPADELRDQTNRNIRRAGRGIFERDTEMVCDISRAACTALATYPDQDIKIGMVFGAAHSVVARRIAHY